MMQIIEKLQALLKIGYDGSARLGRRLMKHRVATVVVSCVLIMAMLMSVISVTINRVDVYDEGKEVLSYYAIESDVESVLEKAELKVSEYDRVTRVMDGGIVTVTVERAFPVYVQADGESVQVMMIKGTVADALKQAKVTLGAEDRLNYEQKDAVADGMKILVDRVTGEHITVTESIDFETEKVKTNKLFVGETEVEQEGKKGKREKVYAITYVNGEETDRELISNEVIEEPTNKIVLVGTKEKPVEKTGNFKATSSAPTSYKKVYQMTCTAYSAGGTTATGRPAKWGVVAVDPKVIPLGSTVYVETVDGKYIYGTAVAADIGGAIKGNKIDICVNSRSEAYSFGRRQVYVYVL
ncbi:MAG: G5 domain-containing protein [Clostridia bacterium]|nr:G5 domain-containing protein [Clostridia bacterium]